MTPPLGAGGHALLRVAACPDADHAAVLSNVPANDWVDLAQRAREARMVPLLWRAITRCPQTPVPQPIAARLSAEARAWRVNALQKQAAIARLGAALKQAGTPAILLKGGALAHTAYPNPALRPMRDIDVLLQPGDAAAAQAALLATGAYCLHPAVRGVRRSSADHLPPLQDRAMGATVELHHAIAGWPGAAALERAIRDGAVERVIAGHRWRVPAAEATVVHLAASAARKDSLASAAIVLADLAYLAGQPIDWDETWRLAERSGAAHALGLLAAVARACGAVWPQPVLSAAADRAEPHADAAMAALLLPAREAQRQRIVARVARSQAGSGGSAARAALRHALTPDPLQLARTARIAADSPWRWLGYPVWLVHRAAGYLAGWRAGRRRATGARGRMERWLAQHDSSEDPNA